MGRILIRSGCVLTLGAKIPNQPVADVLIEEGMIAEIGPGLRARDAEVIDATNAIVMPGFVDAHRHTHTSLFRNLGSTAEPTAVAHFQPEDIYAATLVGLLGALEAGVTTVVDWAPYTDGAFVEAALQAHVDARLRTVFAQPDPVPSHAPKGENTTVALASPDLRRTTMDDVIRRWTAARQSGMRIHAHAGLDPSDAGIVSEIAGKGALGADVTLVHGSHLGEADLDAIAEHHSSVVVAPSSEMAGGLGAPPLQKFLDRKILPGLAVDDERLAPGDMLAQMRAANSIQHAAYFDLKLAGKAGLPNLLTTRDVIRYATIEGAKAVGLGDRTGSLEPGKQADVIVLRTDRPNIYPINDPIGAVVWGVDTSNIDWVIVAGRAVMREGQLEADVERVRGLAATARDRVMASAGIRVERGETA